MPLPVTIRRIVLTGFMGAGKSTIGPLLSAAIGWQFRDSDAAIEARIGLTVAEIFANEGEAAFRALEVRVINEQAHAEDLVFALGGGALEHEPSRQALNRVADACVIFLDAPLDLLVARCLAQPQAAVRPVLADREMLAARLKARLPHYRQAHLTVDTAEMTPEEATQTILTALGGRTARTGSLAESAR
jgi:shikimate kinase